MHASLTTLPVAAARPCVHARHPRSGGGAASTSYASLVRASPRQALAFGQQRNATLGSRPSGLVVAAAASVDATLADAKTMAAKQEDGSLSSFPNAPGVYAVYDADSTLQYIGVSRRIALSVATHAEELPDLTGSVRYSVVTNPTKESLTGAWKEWMQEAIAEAGQVPPGNAPGVKTWTARKLTAVRPEIKLTPGKGAQDLTCSVEVLIEQVVKTNRVVAFVKGTRTAPQCGFSHKVLTMLNESGGQYEVLNVLDEQYNPGLREAIKAYSQWPTIPQVYVDGDFVGGADIVEEMFNSGELQRMIKGAK